MRFKSNPVIINAIHWDGSEIALNQIKAMAASTPELIQYAIASNTLYVLTPEGILAANINDWIVQLPGPVYFPMNPSIFNNFFTLAE